MAKQSRLPWTNPGYGLNLMWQTARMTADAQAIIALRLAKIAGGGAAGLAEARLMVAEKLRALGESHAIALRSVGTPDGGAARITKLYQRKLAANRKRLAKIR
ncbi:MAG: hypothetical protein PHT60_05495 [Acidiphilium sp.]|nr:hypothetical protein [Acidiphilium sp.]MDD4935217.1 hypothetical protein [Acidiphilium sp.]